MERTKRSALWEPDQCREHRQPVLGGFEPFRQRCFSPGAAGSLQQHQSISQPQAKTITITLTYLADPSLTFDLQRAGRVSCAGKLTVKCVMNDNKADFPLTMSYPAAGGAVSGSATGEMVCPAATGPIENPNASSTMVRVIYTIRVDGSYDGKPDGSAGGQAAVHE